MLPPGPTTQHKHRKLAASDRTDEPSLAACAKKGSLSADETHSPGSAHRTFAILPERLGQDRRATPTPHANRLNRLRSRFQFRQAAQR